MALTLGFTWVSLRTYTGLLFPSLLLVHHVVTEVGTSADVDNHDRVAFTIRA